MATLFFPDRTSPTTTLVIPSLESYPSSRPVQKLQARGTTPGGKPLVYDLGGEIQLLVLAIRLLAAADKTSLENFIRNTLNLSSNSFDFTDDNGTEYDTCRVWQDETDFQNVTPGFFEEEILLRQDPA